MGDRDEWVYQILNAIFSGHLSREQSFDKLYLSYDSLRTRGFSISQTRESTLSQNKEEMLDSDSEEEDMDFGQYISLKILINDDEKKEQQQNDQKQQKQEYH